MQISHRREDSSLFSSGSVGTINEREHVLETSKGPAFTPTPLNSTRRHNWVTVQGVHISVVTLSLCRKVVDDVATASTKFTIDCHNGFVYNIYLLFLWSYSREVLTCSEACSVIERAETAAKIGICPQGPEDSTT